MPVTTQTLHAEAACGAPRQEPEVAFPDYALFTEINLLHSEAIGTIRR